MKSKRELTPLGRDPNEEGDCDNPKSLTIHLNEDRWGNHVVVVLESGKEKHRGIITHRGMERAPRRRPFSADADTLRAILREVERGE